MVIFCKWKKTVQPIKKMITSNGRGFLYRPVALLILAWIALLVIIQPWNLYFLNDDFLHIPMPVQWIFLRGGFMRPVPNLFLEIDKALYGNWAPGFFFGTMLMHLFCVIAVFLLCRKVISRFFPEPNHTRIATISALLFMFYPFHAESLMWLISRVSILAAGFTLLSLYFYLRKAERPAYLFLSWLLYTIALFTYESMWNVLMFYMILSFLNFREQRATLRKELIHVIIFVSTFALYMTVRFFSLSSIIGDGYLEYEPNLYNIPLVLKNFINLIARNYTPPTDSSYVFIGLAVVSSIVYGTLVYLIFKKNKRLGWLLILLAIGIGSAVLTASPLGINTHTNESERYIYYSSFFYCFFVAIVIVFLVRKFQALVLTFILIVFITLLSHYQTKYEYSSTVTKTTMQFVAEYPGYKNAYFIDVPEDFKGALIFRISLPDAIRWINPSCKYDSIHLVSKVPQATGELPFTTGEITWQQFADEKKLDSSSHKIITDTGDSKEFKETDVVFWFSKNGLYKINFNQ